MGGQCPIAVGSLRPDIHQQAREIEPDSIREGPAPFHSISGLILTGLKGARRFELLSFSWISSSIQFQQLGHLSDHLGVSFEVFRDEIDLETGTVMGQDTALSIQAAGPGLQDVPGSEYSCSRRSAGTRSPGWSEDTRDERRGEEGDS